MPTDPDLRALADRFAVQDAVNELFLATDAKAWDRVRAVFADVVHFDMTSLAGGEPADLTPAAIAGAWEEGLRDIAAVHHQTGNFVVRVDGDRAHVQCYGIATHYRPEVERRVTTFVGSYDLRLRRDAARGWRIDAFRFDKKYVE